MRNVKTIAIATGLEVDLPEADAAQVAAIIAVLPKMSNPDAEVLDWLIPGTTVTMTAITSSRGPDAHNALNVYADSNEGEIAIYCCRAKGRIAARMIQSIHQSTEVQVAPSLLERSPSRPWVLFDAPTSQLGIVAAVAAAWEALRDGSPERPQK